MITVNLQALVRTLKSLVRSILSKLSLVFLSDISVSQKLNYDLLGHGDDHYFVGYYDKDPVSQSGTHVLCHKVSSNFGNMVEPSNAVIGLLCLADNNFQELAKTNAMNWQLGSRAQWLGKDIIIYNDIINGKQCSVKFDCKKMEPLVVFKRPFWDVSHDKKLAASLNFSRIKTMRPGYGYDGVNIDQDDEVLTVFGLDDDQLICEIKLKEILEKINFENVNNENIYMNHIVWSPCNQKLVTMFHYDDKNTHKRRIFPVLIDIKTKDIDLLCDSGNFSHHTFMDDKRILAYLKLDNEYFFGIWSKDTGWAQVQGPMPALDGHPTYVKSLNRIIVDSYPNRFGIMSLYLGSPTPGDKLKSLAKVHSSPQNVGPIRCDLHPRVSLEHGLVICDVPYKNRRKILVIKGALDV